MGSKLHRAMAFALEAHDGSDREGEAPLPYFTHPIEVLTNLRFVGGVVDEDLLCVAILHDVVEDSANSVSDIESVFGPRVAGPVGELTRREPGPEETERLDKAQIWMLRSEILLSEIASMSREAQIVKLADRLANVQDGKRNKKSEKLKRYLAQTKKVLEIIPESVNRPLWRAIEAEL